MEVFYKVVAMFGGLAMFLYGMRVMGDALKSQSGGVMKAALEAVTKNPALGFLFGMFVTCVIQSSTATIVLTVGLVGAGFIKFRQSIGIVLGANVGTAITAQIIRLMDLSAGAGSLLYFFKADNLAPLALSIGIVFIMFLKGERFRNSGTVLVGFGILFMGLIYMSSTVSTMGDQLSGLLTAFEDNYILGFLSGVVVTGIIQSSSAVVGILQSLASSVGLPFCSVFAVIIGVNIGDCLTTFLVSRIGASPQQIRTALVHVIYNIFAALLIIVLLTVGRLTGLISDTMWTMVLKSGGVANVHGIFRLVPAVCLLPFAGLFAYLAEKIVPDKPVDEEDAEIEMNLRELDRRLLTNPQLALDQSAHLIMHMADTASHNFDAVMQQLHDFDEKRAERIDRRENLLDRITDAANSYVVDISPYITRDVDSVRQSFQVKTITSLERIGDHAHDLANDVKELRSKGTQLSEGAAADLDVALGAVREILDVTCDAILLGDVVKAKQVEPMEEVIDDLIEELKSRHIYRMTHGTRDIIAGIRYENMMSHLERISDQCSDLAVYTIESADPSIVGSEHKYIHELHRTQDTAYWDLYNSNRDKYFSALSTPKTDQPSGDVPEGAAFEAHV